MTNPLQDESKQPLQVPERFSKGELQALRTLRDNDVIFKALLKIFLPTGTDPDMPIEYSVDIWHELDFSSMTADEAKIAMCARRDLIKWVRGSLMLLKTIALSEPEGTDEEIKERLKKDSNQ